MLERGGEGGWGSLMAFFYWVGTFSRGSVVWTSLFPRFAEAGAGKIAGIISAVGAAIVGAVTSYIAYQKKKLCFKIQGGEGEFLQMLIFPLLIAGWYEVFVYKRPSHFLYRPGDPESANKESGTQSDPQGTSSLPQISTLCVIVLLFVSSVGGKWVIPLRFTVYLTAPFHRLPHSTVSPFTSQHRFTIYLSAVSPFTSQRRFTIYLSAVSLLASQHRFTVYLTAPFHRLPHGAVSPFTSRRRFTVYLTAPFHRLPHGAVSPFTSRRRFTVYLTAPFHRLPHCAVSPFTSQRRFTVYLTAPFHRLPHSAVSSFTSQRRFTVSLTAPFDHFPHSAVYLTMIFLLPSNCSYEQPAQITLSFSSGEHWDDSLHVHLSPDLQVKASCDFKVVAVTILVTDVVAIVTHKCAVELNWDFFLFFFIFFFIFYFF